MPAHSLYNEQELLVLASGGDQIAFATIVDHYSSIVYHHLITYVKDARHAKELAQDVFISIWNSRGKLAEIQNFGAYINVTCRNKAKKALIELAENYSIPVDSVQQLFQVPDNRLEYNELQQLLDKAIESLPGRRREVFKLSRMEQLSYEEIAQRLTISKSAVRQHIIAALVDLRLYLHNHAGIIISSTVLWLFPFGIFLF